MRNTLSKQFKHCRSFVGGKLFTGTSVLAVGLLSSLTTPAFAQYTVTNLVSNQNAIGTNPADPALVNAWGITSLATSPFWLSDNGTGLSTLYNSLGQKQNLVVTVPGWRKYRPRHSDRRDRQYHRPIQYHVE